MRQTDVLMGRGMMSKWIDADALIESIKNTADLGGWIGEALYQIKQVAIKYIDSAPSIDIVRCAECKYKQQCHKAVEHTTRDATSVTIAYRPIDFCSYGEREGE